MRKFLINIKLFLCKLSISFDDEFKIYNQWFNYQTVNKLTQEYCLILKFITIDDNFNYYVMSKLRDGLKDGKSLITKCKSRSPDTFDAKHCI